MAPDSSLPLPLSPLLPSGTPLYLQVKRAVMAALAQGEWTQGDAIPPERALAERFGVSIGTLRKAIDELAAENILIRHQGRGTFVAMHDRNPHFFRYFRIVRQDGVKAYPETRLLQFRSAVASQEAAQRLGLAQDSRVFEFVNRLSLHGQPVVIDVITVPAPLFPGLSRSRVEQRPSTVYSFYQDAFGVNVIGTQEHVRVAQDAGEYAQLLGLAPDHPLLQLRRVAYSFNHRAVEWRLSYVNTDAYEYLGQHYEG